MLPRPHIGHKLPVFPSSTVLSFPHRSQILRSILLSKIKSPVKVGLTREVWEAYGSTGRIKVLYSLEDVFPQAPKIDATF